MNRAGLGLGAAGRARGQGSRTYRDGPMKVPHRCGEAGHDGERGQHRDNNGPDRLRARARPRARMGTGTGTVSGCGIVRLNEAGVRAVVLPAWCVFSGVDGRRAVERRGHGLRRRMKRSCRPKRPRNAGCGSRSGTCGMTERYVPRARSTARTATTPQSASSNATKFGQQGFNRARTAASLSTHGDVAEFGQRRRRSSRAFTATLS